MPKWVLFLIALAALAGIVWLEQRWTPQMERVVEAPSAPAVVSPVAPPPVEPEPQPMPAHEPEPAPEEVPTPRPEDEPQTEPRPTTPSPSAIPPAASPFGEPAGIAESLPTLEPPTGSVARWEGLDVETFLSQAGEEMLLLSPESVTYLGLEEVLGVRNDRLDSLSVESEDAWWRLLNEIDAHLTTFDLDEADETTRRHVAVYSAWLDGLFAFRAFPAHGYLVSSYMDSYPSYLEWFMTSLHVLSTVADVEDYLARLSEIPTRFAEAETRMARSEAVGSLAPRFMLDAAAEQLQSTGTSAAEDTSYYAALAWALDEMADVDDDHRAHFLSMAAEVLSEAVLPAYRRLADAVAATAERAPEEGGAWRAENGAAYYAACLAAETTTTLAAEEIYELGLQEVDRLEAEIRAAAAELGLSSTATIPALFDEVETLTGSSLGEETLDRCSALIEGIVPLVAPAFRRMPAGDIVVVDGGSYTYFSAGTPDGSRPGQYFAPTETPQPIYELPTVTYHEAIPGHGFAAAYVAEAEIPDYLSGISFTAYAEGWALYAERLAWELGAYEEDPYGNLGRLQDELFRAVRLVVDPGLHAKGWPYEQAVAYMLDHTGFSEDYVRSEVERYLVTPGQAVTYKIGMIKILELRELAQTGLGEAFDLASFHDAVLSSGEVPLSILGELVLSYIDEVTSAVGSSAAAEATP